MLSFNTVRSRVVLVLISGLQILHSSQWQLNISMRTLLHITLAYSLMGCANIQSTIDNGIGQVPGQRVHVTTTVLKW